MLACDAQTSEVRTAEYDGPLELLLFLVRLHGVDIRHMPIAPITDAYLAQLKLMDILDLDTAGEFLVIASTLCLIKSREMFPRTRIFDGQEDEDDPATLLDDLARRLLEYERYKEASETLEGRLWLDRDVFARHQQPTDPSDIIVDPGVDSLGLLQIFYGVLQHHAADPVTHQVTRETVSMEEVAVWMLGRIKQGPRELNSLLSSMGSSAQRVMGFLCALEMAKLQMIDLQQAGHLGPIVLEAAQTPSDHDLSLLLGATA
jgi:segregation and condensation protein A